MSKRQAARSWCRRSTSAAGTTRACRRIAGLRRRGYTPEAIRDVLRADRRRQVRQHRSTWRWLEDALREDLNKRAPRVMAVLRPLKVVIENYPGGPGRGARRGQQPGGPVGWARARCRSRASSTSSRTTSARTRRRSSSASRPGREVRLRYAYFITCTERGEGRRRATSIELRCTYDPATRGGDAPGRPQGEGHDPLGLGRARASTPRCGSTTTCSRKRRPGRRAGGQDCTANLNPNSLEVLTGCKLEPSLAAAAAGERASSSSGMGYFCVDPRLDAGQARCSTAR